MSDDTQYSDLQRLMFAVEHLTEQLDRATTEYVRLNEGDTSSTEEKPDVSQSETTEEESEDESVDHHLLKDVLKRGLDQEWNLVPGLINITSVPDHNHFVLEAKPKLDTTEGSVWRQMTESMFGPETTNWIEKPRADGTTYTYPQFVFDFDRVAEVFG